MPDHFSPRPDAPPIFWPFGAIQDPWVDAAQRAILTLDALREAQPPEKRLTLPQFRALVRDQSRLLPMDEARALATLDGQLPPVAGLRARAFAALRKPAPRGRA